MKHLAECIASFTSYTQADLRTHLGQPDRTVREVNDIPRNQVCFLFSYVFIHC